MILPFGWTRDLLPDMGGCKEETRRDWSDHHLSTWQKQFDNDPLKWHKAYDKSQRQGGSQVGWIQLKERPYRQILSAMDKAAVAREGHPDWSPEQFIKHYFWKPNKKWTEEQSHAEWELLLSKEMAVVRFEYIQLNSISAALLKAFPNPSLSDIDAFFWNATPFPAGNTQDIVDRISEYVERGAKSIDDCLGMACEDMDEAMRQYEAEKFGDD